MHYAGSNQGGIMNVTHKLTILWICISTAAVTAILSCNNPFSTRNVEKPSDISGAFIKPANSPENVLYNLRATFESMSTQDFIDVFSEDFTFNPDPDDSLLYEVVFRNGWGYDEENTFAENFLLNTVTSEIEFSTHTYEYKSGEDMYDYRYSIMIFPPDSTDINRTSIKGHAWIYLKENADGRWKIYKWVEITNMIEGAFYTWGVLRALYAGF